MHRQRARYTVDSHGWCMHAHVVVNLQSKRLLIESQWVPEPLAFAGKLRPRRLNHIHTCDRWREPHVAAAPPSY